MPLKVLQVVPDMNSGGVESEALEIAKFLAANKVSSYVASNGGSLVRTLEESGSKHVKLPVNTKNPFKMILNVYWLSKIIKELDIDILHCRSRAPAWSCYFASLITRVKYVTTFHAAYSATHPLKRFYNSIMLRSHKVIAISDFIKKHIETKYHFISDKLSVIDRGVDLETFAESKISSERVDSIKDKLGIAKSLGKETKLIIMPSRYTRIKGHIYLIKALKYIKNENFICMFVGKYTDKNYDYVKEIELEIAACGLSNKVFLHKESIQDVAALYKCSDIVVCASIEPEGFGRTIIEAQAINRVVVATEIGAPADIIEHEKTGFLAPVSNASEFAEVLHAALNLGKSEKASILKNAYAKVKEKYNLEVMCQSTLKIYKSLLDR